MRVAEGLHQLPKGGAHHGGRRQYKRNMQDGWKILVATLACLTGIFIFLVAIASPGIDDNQETPSENPGLTAPETPAGPAGSAALKGFQLIPGSARLVDDRHVIALFKNPEKNSMPLPCLPRTATKPAARRPS
jgi:hypothetical protein